MGKDSIRQAYMTDLPYFYRICLATGFQGKDASELYSDPYLLGQFYAAPYLCCSRECCFALVSGETGCAAGYIVGTADSAAFTQWRNTQWLPPVAESCLHTETAARTESEAGIRALIISNAGVTAINDEDRELFASYPAHFHIDILPALQKKGYGSKLIASFTGKLKETGVPGVHLGVDKNNTGACAFYLKQGFSVVREEPWGFILGMKL